MATYQIGPTVGQGYDDVRYDEFCNTLMLFRCNNNQFFNLLYLKWVVEVPINNNLISIFDEFKLAIDCIS